MSKTERRVEGKKVTKETYPAGWRTLIAEAEVPRDRAGWPVGQKPRWRQGRASHPVPRPGKDVETEPHPSNPEVPESQSGPTTCSSNMEGAEKLLQYFQS